MKIVFFGTPDFAIPFFKSLTSDPEIEIQAVITQPDKPVGRKKVLTKPPIKIVAEEYDFSVLQPESLRNNSHLLDLLKGLSPDFIVVVAYGMILPEEIIKIPKYSCINVHASLLPVYRGASPIQSALLNGDKETGISIMKINKKLDTGEIYLLRKVEIHPEDTSIILSKRLSEIGAILLPSALKDIKDGVLSPLPQDETKAVYSKKISRKDALIDPEKETAKSIINKFRAFQPWPGINMIFKGKRLKILKMNLTEKHELKPGKLDTQDNHLLLGTKKGTLDLVEVQLEGKNPLSANEFINGFLK